MGDPDYGTAGGSAVSAASPRVPFDAQKKTGSDKAQLRSWERAQQRCGKQKLPARIVQIQSRSTRCPVAAVRRPSSISCLLFC